MNLPKKYTNKETLQSLYWALEQTSLVILAVFAMIVGFNLLWNTWVSYLTLDPDQMLDPDWTFHSIMRAAFAALIGCSATLMYHIRKQKRKKQDPGAEDND